MEKKKTQPTFQKSLRSGPANPAFFAKPKNDGGDNVLTFDIREEEIKYVEGADGDEEGSATMGGIGTPEVKEYKPLKLAWFFDEKDFIQNEERVTKLNLRDEFKDLKSKLAIS